MSRRTVPVLTDGTHRRPDLPEGVGYSVLEDQGDTMLVDVDDAPERLTAVEDAIDTLILDTLMGGL